MNTLEVTFMLIERLERMPADSIWAHRASGVRGALLKMADRLENRLPVSRSMLDRMISKGYEILEKSTVEKQSYKLKSPRS